ncbi:hypothetical protein [Schleiferilactobacillus perolens]|jgi:membrane protease YdiL (CAAX protease family)|uniref:hypothetical protein n=1 Tax=Schleiferilactobacillus perolens TaxID=100468 RepID=UPI002353D1A1|nr:hypothetical protein [Schleiferilactobacillus perolens]MCI1913212.1 hypothetical protein [Schleiferilactobacillus harbinensis]MCI2171525.1 hypothetical protein [Schleiferilactobacillus perolens]
MMKEQSTKRRLWPSLFSEDQPIATINEWIKVLATIWLIYLLFNTKNPLSIYFTPSVTEFRMHGSLGLDLRLIGAGLLFLGLVLASAWWAFGKAGIVKLFPRWRVRDGFMTFGYGLLTWLFFLIGNIFADFVHAKYFVNTDSALDLGQFDSWSNYWVVTARYVPMMIGQILALILIFLALYQIGRHVIPQTSRFLRGLTTFLIYVVAAVAYAGIMTTPLNPNFAQNVWINGMMAIPMLWAYRRTRNVLVPMIGVIVLERAAIALVLLFSM